MSIGSRVRARRREMKLSQEHLARRADMSLKVVQRLETGGITDPHYTTLVRLAHALGMSVAELVGESESVVPKAPRRSSPDMVEERPLSAGGEGYWFQMMTGGLQDQMYVSIREVMQAMEYAGLSYGDRELVLKGLVGPSPVAEVRTEVRRGSASQ